MKKIYLDNASTTNVSKAIIAKIKPLLDLQFGNPSSKHFLGIEAKKEVDSARKTLAEEIGVKPYEIIFTSSGTEANALAILGVARASGKKRIIISSIEHSSVYENAKLLEKEGFEVIEIPFLEKKGLDLEFLKKNIDNKTALVSVVHVNSDVGIVNDIRKIAKICNDKKVPFHADALQSFGKMKIQAKNIGIDLLSASGHKIGGPKGSAFLYVREGINIEPIFSGGKQEKGLFSGTQNVPSIVGFAEALKEYRRVDWKNIGRVRDFAEIELEKIGAKITCKNIDRGQTHIHVCFPGIDSEQLVNYLSTKGIYVSTGSACDSNKEDSRVLDKIGVEKSLQRGALRITLGKSTKKSDLTYLIVSVKNYLNRFKKRN